MVPFTRDEIEVEGNEKKHDSYSTTGCRYSCAHGSTYIIHTLFEPFPLLATCKKQRSVVALALSRRTELQERVRDRLTIRRM